MHCAGSRADLNGHGWNTLKGVPNPLFGAPLTIFELVLECVPQGRTLLNIRRGSAASSGVQSLGALTQKRNGKWRGLLMPTVTVSGMSLCLCLCMCARAQVYYHFYQVSWLSLYGHTGVLRSGRSPLVQAFGTGQGCVPVLPLDHCDMHFRPEHGSLPQDHLGSGAVAPWLPPGQLQGIGSTSPSVPCCPVCHSWWCSRQRGGLRWRFPQKDALDTRLPPPPSGMPDLGLDPTTFRLRDLHLARLS